MQVECAQDADRAAWLRLAAEVEPLFGPMLSDPGYHRALEKNIRRGTALCVREHNGPPGTPLMGGLLYSSCGCKYEIDWLAVAQRWQRQGVGRALVEHLFGLIRPPAEVVLITFAPDVAAGVPARCFYERHGFAPAEPGPPNAAGITTQVYRRVIGKSPTVRAVIQHANRFLLVQHNHQRPENIGHWGIPGGQIDPCDTDRKAALRRELHEELGVEPEIGRFINTYPYRERLHHVYHVRLPARTLTFDRQEILDHAWLTLDQVAALHAAGKLHTGFELAAITASQSRSRF